MNEQSVHTDIHPRFRRWVRRDLVGTLSQRLRGRLAEHLRSCHSCRNFYDECAIGLRVFEHNEMWTTNEIHGVEARLFGLTDSPAANFVQRWRERIKENRSRYLVLASWAGVAAVTALALVTSRPGPQDQDNTFGVRGRDSVTELGLQVLCGKPLRDASQGCFDNEAMTFAHWRPSLRSPQPETSIDVVLFGVDERGTALYYAPTPVDPATAVLGGTEAQWQPIDLAIQLGVNHQLGTVRVFALAIERNAKRSTNVSIEQIDQWAVALHQLPSVEEADPPWTLRIDPGLLESVCGEYFDTRSTSESQTSRCTAAETHFTVLPNSTQNSNHRFGK